MYFHTSTGALKVAVAPPPAAVPYNSGYAFTSLEAMYVIPWDPAAPLPANTVYEGGLARSSLGGLYVTEGTPSAAEKSLGVPARTMNGICFVSSAAPGGGSTFTAPWGMCNSAGQLHIDLAFGLGFADLGAGAVSLVAGVSGATPTFTRATAATTIGPTGLVVAVASGVARSYYDPTSLAYLGYLAEGARTNLLLRSEEFDNASWSKTDITVTADSIVSPDGTQNADLLTNGTAGTSVVVQQVTATADVVYTASVWLKRGNNDWIRLQIANGVNGVRAWFNVATGAAGTVAAFGTGASQASTIKAYPNGWYRATLTGSVGSGATAINTFISAVAADNNSTPTNSATFHPWGAQFENNVSFASSYIPTAGATVTRNADVLTYPTTGWLNASAGTLFTQFTQPAVLTASNRFVGIYLAADAPNERLVTGNVTTTNVTASTIAGGVTQAALTLGTSGAAATAKTAYAYQANNFAGTLNGGTVATDASGTLPTVDTLRVGHDGAGASGTELFSAVSRIGYWNTRQTNGFLQAVTT